MDPALIKEEMMKEADKDGNGTIDESELYKAMRSANLRVSKAEASEMFA